MKEANGFILGIVTTLIVLGVAGGAYYYSNSQTSQVLPTPTIAPSTITNAPQETLEPTAEPTDKPQKSANKSAVIENIQAAVESKNYAALESYMTGSVSVILYATECCGVLSKQKATEQMSYLNQGTPPWDFSGTSSIAQKLIDADPANFSGRMIGIASNGLAVSFNLNNANKIDKIFISANYKLIAP